MTAPTPTRAPVQRPRPTRRSVTVFAVLGTLSGLSACGADPASPLTSADVVGTYALTSIAGTALPAPYGEGTALLYDTLTMARDSTVTERDGAGALGSRVVTYPGRYAGRWTLDATGGQLRITYPGAGNTSTTSTFTVVNRGASLTLTVPGFTDPPAPGGGLWVYTRVR